MKKILIIMILFASTVYSADIFEAIKSGDINTIEQIIAQDKNVLQATNERSNTPLHIACYYGNPDLVRLLVEKGAAIEAVNGRGMTPLIYAIFSRNFETVKYLIEKGASISNSNSGAGMSPRHLAFSIGVRSGNLEIARYIISLDQDFDPHYRAPNGFTDLMSAISFGSSEGVQLLLEHGLDVNRSHRPDGLMPLADAAQRGKTNIVKFLLENGADINALGPNSIPAIKWAVERGKLDIVNLLIQSGAKTDFIDTSTGRNLLHLACIAGIKDLVTKILPLIDNIDELDNENHSPRYFAGKYGHGQISHLLIERGSGTPGDFSDNSERSPYLESELPEGQLITWQLNNRGWAVKTKNAMLIFDAEEFSAIRPTEPSLANGFLTPEEIENENIYALYSCYHGLPGEPAYIHQLEDTLDNITYIHNSGDRWRGCKNSFYLEPGTNFELGELRIKTIPVTESMTSLGYMITVDDLTIYFAGFRPENFDNFKIEIDSLAQNQESIDLAFIVVPGPDEPNDEIQYVLDKLKPKSVVLYDIDKRYSICRQKAGEISQSGYWGEIFYPEFPGDNFVYTKDR